MIIPEAIELSWVFDSNAFVDATKNVMLGEYMNKMVLALQEIFPSLTRKNALCILYSTINYTEDDTLIDQILITKIKQVVLHRMQQEFNDLTDEGTVLAIAELYEDTGTAGTHSSNQNCN